MKALLTALVFLSLVMTSCYDGVVGKGDVLTREYSFEAFSGIRYDLPGKVIYEQGEPFVSVTTNENLFEYFDFRVDGPNLRLQLVDHIQIMDYDKLLIKISSPDLSRFETDGSGDLISEKPVHVKDKLNLKIDGSGEIKMSELTADRLDLEIDGSGDIRINKLVVDRMECNVDGSGDFVLDGSADKFEIDIDGSGSVLASNLKINKIDIDINGSGNCYVWAVKEIKLRINGSGSVYYKGNPDVKSEVNGSGKVTHQR